MLSSFHVAVAIAKASSYSKRIQEKRNVAYEMEMETKAKMQWQKKEETTTHNTQMKNEDSKKKKK